MKYEQHVFVKNIYVDTHLLTVQSSTTRSTPSASLMQQRSGKRPLQWGPRRVRGSEHPRARPAFLTPRAVPGTRWGWVWALKASVVG